MTKGKRILVIASTEADASIMRYMLSRNRPNSNAGYYIVTTATTKDEAVSILKEKSFETLLYCWPVDGADEILNHAREFDMMMTVLVIARNRDYVNFPAVIGNANVVLHNPSSVEILDRVATLAARKRGPRKGYIRAVPMSV